MKNCPLCGTPAAINDRYCRSCGTVINEVTQKKKKGSLGSFILGLVIGFLLAVVIGFFAVSALFNFFIEEGLEAFFDDFSYSEQYDDDWLFGDDFGQNGQYGQNGQTKPTPGDNDNYQGGKDWLFGNE